MISFKYIKSALFILICSISLTCSNFCSEKVTAQSVTSIISEQVQEATISPLNIVKSPKSYLNQNVKIKTKFDKFSTLGLDYKSAFRSSEDYISFLIKREDTTYDIPLSEMKLFLKRTDAEKYIDLKTNDEILITGSVFSDALGDAWIDVKTIDLIKKAPDKKDGV